MKEKKNFIVYLPVFNSYQNLKEIFISLKKLNHTITEIIIIDNNSSLLENEKKEIINSLNSNFNFSVKLVLNKENYGIGGSKKILYSILKKKNINYLCFILTSKRFSSEELVKQIDYLVFSRFINKESSSQYSLLRKIGNIFFIYLTKILSKCYLTDPGSIIYVQSKKCFNEILKLNISEITNGSHYGHFLNILIFKKKNLLKIKEIPIVFTDRTIGESKMSNKIVLEAIKVVPLLKIKKILGK